MELKKSIEFVLKFFLIYFVFQIIIYWIGVGFLENLIAYLIGLMHGLSSTGNEIYFNEIVFVIGFNCTGIISAIIFAGIIFSMKKPELKEKIKIFLIGTILLFFINLIRIYFVVLSEIYFNIAEITHFISWFAMTGFIIFFWYYLTKKITRIKNFKDFL